MTQEDYRHPIAPPPELVQQWIDANRTWLRGIALEAAQWGADQELEACCALLNKFNDGFWCEELRAARRPKQPSLKEQALGLLNEGPVSELLDHEVDTIRRALEQLDD